MQQHHKDMNFGIIRLCICDDYYISRRNKHFNSFSFGTLLNICISYVVLSSLCVNCQ
jgi:hypothetical protein